MERIAEYPGLAQTPEYYERAYRTDDGDVARVRFRPVQLDPALTANLPLMSIQVTMFVSASLVDEQGQVLQIGGRGLVADARSHGWSFQGDGDLDMDVWLDQLAEQEIAPLSRAAKAYRAFPQLVVPVAKEQEVVEAAESPVLLDASVPVPLSGSDPNYPPIHTEEQ